MELSDVAELIAFNDHYRPKGMAPDQVWASLDGDTRDNLQHLEGCRDIVIAECKRLDRLAYKWGGADLADYKPFDTLYEFAFAKYKEDAGRYNLVDGHWQSPEESAFPDDSRYWQLENPTTSATTSAVIRFLPSRENQQYVLKETLGLMKHYVCNILVLNDPKHPENNGKVFVFRFGPNSRALLKIIDMMSPPPEFADMESIDPFDMKTGCNFKLRAVRIDGMVNLDKSAFDKPTPVGDSGVIADLRTRVYSLGDEQ
jgi:hypothetical protein